MLWEQFRSLALPLLGEHFPPNLVKDNGDSLTFVDRRERLRFFLTESAQGITIGDYEERNTVGIIFTSPSIELATIALTLLVREGLGELVDMDYPPDELLGPVPGTDYSITEDRSRGFHSPTIPTARSGQNASILHTPILSPRPRPPPWVHYGRRINVVDSAL